MCAYIVNEDYDRPDGRAPAEERAELQRIQREGFEKKLEVGSVRVFILSPDGHPYSLVPTDTSRAMLVTLGKAVEEFKPTPGKPIVPPGPQSAPPDAPADAVILHLVSRGDDRGSWGEFPAENWIVLTREDWAKILPAGSIDPGQTWELDRGVSARILTYFYPQTENNNVTVDRIRSLSLTAKALTVKDGLVTARVDGFVRMRHVFYPGRKDAQPLEAEVVGVLAFTPGKPPLLQLVTTKAVHGQRPFKVAVQTVTRAAQ